MFSNAGDNITLQLAEPSAEAPIAWLRLEPSSSKAHAELRLTVWLEGTEHLLAESAYHGSWDNWFGAVQN